MGREDTEGGLEREARTRKLNWERYGRAPPRRTWRCGAVCEQWGRIVCSPSVTGAVAAAEPGFGFMRPVPMHQPLHVQELQRVEDLGHDGAKDRKVAGGLRPDHGHLDRQRIGASGSRRDWIERRLISLLRAAPERQQITSLDELHGKEPALVLLGQVEQAHQVLVMKLGGDPEFLLEAQQPLRILGQHHLQGQT